MKNILLYILILFSLLSFIMADCGCGAKCIKYSDANHCTRCCTGTLKRSLSEQKSNSYTRGHRFLLPPVGTSPYRIPMWLQDNTERMNKKNKREDASVERILNELNEIIEAIDETRRRIESF